MDKKIDDLNVDYIGAGKIEEKTTSACLEDIQQTAEEVVLCTEEKKDTIIDQFSKDNNFILDFDIILTPPPSNTASNENLYINPLKTDLKKDKLDLKTSLLKDKLNLEANLLKKELNLRASSLKDELDSETSLLKDKLDLKTSSLKDRKTCSMSSLSAKYETPPQTMFLEHKTNSGAELFGAYKSLPKDKIATISSSNRTIDAFNNPTNFTFTMPLGNIIVHEPKILGKNLPFAGNEPRPKSKKNPPTSNFVHELHQMLEEGNKTERNKSHKKRKYKFSEGAKDIKSANKMFMFSGDKNSSTSDKKKEKGSPVFPIDNSGVSVSQEGMKEAASSSVVDAESPIPSINLDRLFDEKGPYVSYNSLSENLKPVSSPVSLGDESSPFAPSFSGEKAAYFGSIYNLVETSRKLTSLDFLDPSRYPIISEIKYFEKDRFIGFKFELNYYREIKDNIENVVPFIKINYEHDKAFHVGNIRDNDDLFSQVLDYETCFMNSMGDFMRDYGHILKDSILKRRKSCGVCIQGSWEHSSAAYSLLLLTSNFFVHKNEEDSFRYFDNMFGEYIPYINYIDLELLLPVELKQESINHFRKFRIPHLNKKYRVSHLNSFETRLHVYFSSYDNNTERSLFPFLNEEGISYIFYKEMRTSLYGELSYIFFPYNMRESLEYKEILWRLNSLLLDGNKYLSCKKDVNNKRKNNLICNKIMRDYRFSFVEYGRYGYSIKHLKRTMLNRIYHFFHTPYFLISSLYKKMNKSYAEDRNKMFLATSFLMERRKKHYAALEHLNIYSSFGFCSYLFKEKQINVSYSPFVILLAYYMQDKGPLFYMGAFSVYMLYKGLLSLDQKRKEDYYKQRDCIETAKKLLDEQCVFGLNKPGENYLTTGIDPI